MRNPQTILTIVGLAIIWLGRVMCLLAVAYLVHSALTMFLVADPALLAIAFGVIAGWGCARIWVYLRRKKLQAFWKDN